VRLLDRLDHWGTDDPDFNEGQPEDRCQLCEWPVTDHPVGPTLPDALHRAKWPHRRAAAIDMILAAIERLLR
jgi:hypothetical protein